MLASVERWMIAAATWLMSEKCVRLKYCSMAGNASSLVRSRTPALRTSYHWEAYSARKVVASFSKWALRALSYRCKSLAFSCSLFIRSLFHQCSEKGENPPPQMSEGGGCTNHSFTKGARLQDPVRGTAKLTIHFPCSICRSAYPQSCVRAGSLLR